MFQEFRLSNDQVVQYRQEGYIILKKLVTSEEIEKLMAYALQDPIFSNNSFDLNDSEGKKTRLSLWYKAGDDPFGLLSKSQRILKSVDALMDGESAVCHFHSKLMYKEPKKGGAWEWHQDYGYWYKNEFLFPDQMISVMTALSEATKENGCLQVVPGSHKMGRIEHGFSGEQVGASQHYVELALKSLPLVYAELDPGDVLIFHSNLLHRSAANLSTKPRWSIISCYNRSGNIPYNEPSGMSTVPVEWVPDEAIMNSKLKGLDESAHFLRKEEDKALE